MNRKLNVRIGCGALLMGTAIAMAAPIPDAGTRESLIRSERLTPLSVGADVASFDRDLRWKAGGGLTTLSAESRTALLGFDPVPWLTVFGSFGQVEANLLNSKPDGNGPIWSVGASLNLWHYDVVQPPFIAGRLSLRGGAQFTSAEFDDVLAGSGEWQEGAFSGTLNYEIFSDRKEALQQVPYSLLLYVGWVQSQVDGEIGTGAGKLKFEADETIGTVYGADFFLSSNLSVGIHLQSFESVNWRASLRYRF